MLIHLPNPAKRASHIVFLATLGTVLGIGGCGNQGQTTAPPSPDGTPAPQPTESADPIAHVYKCGERPGTLPASQGPLTLRLTAVRRDHDGAPVADYTITSAIAAQITNPADTRPFRLLILEHGIIVGGQNPERPLAFGAYAMVPAQINPARPSNGTVKLYVSQPCPGHTWQELGKKSSAGQALLIAMPYLTDQKNQRKHILTARLSATAPLPS